MVSHKVMKFVVFKGIKLRIYPNKEQKLKIKLNFGYNRFVWNQMLNMLIQRHENNPDAKFLNTFALNNLLPSLKLEYPWLKDADSRGLQCTNHDLIEAYKKLFREHSGFPKFRSKKYPKQSYQSKTNGKGNIRQVSKHHIKLPKLGIIRFRSGKLISDNIKSVTIELSSTHKYYAVLLVECENQAFKKTGKQLGIDLGIADLIIGSNGTKIPTIRFDKLLSRKKHYWEKRLARRLRQAKKEIAWDHHNKELNPRHISDFMNVQKAKLMVSKYSEKVTNQRTDYLHKITTKLVQDNDLIVMEDLKTKKLLHNHKLSRAIANQSWREFRQQLEYKCSWYGKKLVIVNPYKTSQVCSTCGYDDGKHTLDVRDWICPSCGQVHDRDINAAKNILHIGTGRVLVK